jgi:hypothetical protein
VEHQAPKAESWRERFEEGIKEWREGGGPYWPDWDKVESLIASELAATEGRVRGEITKKWAKKLITVIESLPEPMLEKFIAPNSPESAIEQITEIVNKMCKSVSLLSPSKE